MKAIMISIRPKWVCKIVDDKTKKDEIRKGSSLYKAINKLIEEQGVAPMFIYCTKSNKHECLEYADNPNPNKEGKWVITSGYPYANGKVVARFNATADLLELKMIEGGLYFTTPDRDCFTPNLDLNENAQIDNWQLLDYTGEKLGTQISDIHINDLEIFDKPKDISEFTHWKKYDDCLQTMKLTRAPQSWCYVEV